MIEIDTICMLRCLFTAHTFDLPCRMSTQHTFQVESLCPYYQHEHCSDDENTHHAQEFPSESCDHVVGIHISRVVKNSMHVVMICPGDTRPFCHQDENSFDM